MSERTPCSVPGCDRTTAKPFGEWICGKHWSLLTKDERRVWHRHKRQERRFGAPLRQAAYDRIWKALKRRADPRTPPAHR